MRKTKEMNLDKNAIRFNPLGGGADFILEAKSAWLEVDDVSIWIRRMPSGGVAIECFEKGDEMGSPIESIQVY